MNPRSLIATSPATVTHFLIAAAESTEKAWLGKLMLIISLILLVIFQQRRVTKRLVKSTKNVNGQNTPGEGDAEGRAPNSLRVRQEWMGVRRADRVEVSMGIKEPDMRDPGVQQATRRIPHLSCCSACGNNTEVWRASQSPNAFSDNSELLVLLRVRIGCLTICSRPTSGYMRIFHCIWIISIDVPL